MPTYEEKRTALETLQKKVQKRERRIRKESERIWTRLRKLEEEQLIENAGLTQHEIKDFKEALEAVGSVLTGRHVILGGLHIEDGEPDVMHGDSIGKKKYSIDMSCEFVFDSGVSGLSCGVKIKTKNGAIKQIVRNTFVQEGGRWGGAGDAWCIDWDYGHSIKMRTT